MRVSKGLSIVLAIGLGVLSVLVPAGLGAQSANAAESGDDTLELEQLQNEADKAGEQGMLPATVSPTQRTFDTSNGTVAGQFEPPARRMMRSLRGEDEPTDLRISLLQFAKNADPETLTFSWTNHVSLAQTGYQVMIYASGSELGDPIYDSGACSGARHSQSASAI